MPSNANLAFASSASRFFRGSRITGRRKFFATAFSPIGLSFGYSRALGVTVLPLLLIGCFARGGLWKLNFVDLSGLFAGSMTNPPGLAFATNLSGTDAPHVAYATVYPLTMLLRILSAQVMGNHPSDNADHSFHVAIEPRSDKIEAA